MIMYSHEEFSMVDLKRIEKISEVAKDNLWEFYKEDISDGLEKAPSALSGLYRGENTGRCLIRVNPDPTL